LPVARVVVNRGVLNLDQFFDYAVPEVLDAAAQPGVSRTPPVSGTRPVGVPAAGSGAGPRCRWCLVRIWL
ncbi:hypothetical protein ACFC7A_28835, partial [Streptomyces niveus]|uniref:hypothetical protein n=1 Tax=Streptomyces niveus TaxID=193462 RepID=UPI0035E240C5